jgi:cardiolipin synthase
VRPQSGRTLPWELRPENVGLLAGALPAGLRDAGFVDLLQRIDQGPVLEGNRVKVFPSGEDAFAAIREAIGGARTEILVESYIVRDDATGRSFMELLGRAVGRGVIVKVLADAWGSLMTRRSFWREMKQRGIEARLFHPLFPHIILQPFRDHRKILVVDRQVGFTGGMNIADEYGSSINPTGGPWRDTQVRVEGTAAWELSIVFSEAWHRAGGSVLDLSLLNPPAPGGAAVLVLDSRPGRGYQETSSVLSAIVAAARDRVWITNAYFAPRARALERLGEAVRRGVDVRLILPGRSDVPLVRHAGHGYYPQLLRLGVRVYEYKVAILHAKCLVADDFVSVVGSTNLDFRSFHFNAECNLVILDDRTGAAMAESFRQDLANSTEIYVDAWRRRSAIHRLGDTLARCLAPLL